MDQGNTKYVPRRTVAVAFGCMALSVFALLLWGKLKLVAGVPRTAYAVPEKAAAKPAKPPTPKPETKTTAVSPSEGDIMRD